MSSKQFDLLVFIGRFQPFHTGHQEVVEHALDLADRVLILVGSSNQPRTIKNPWNYNERCDMIYGSLVDDQAARVLTAPLRDHAYNDQAWAIRVQEMVEQTSAPFATNSKRGLRIGLIGHTKDESSYYLKMFPQWKVVEHEMNEVVNATDLRELMFDGKNLKFLKALLSPWVYRTIEEFSSTDSFKKLMAEYDHIRKYKKAWEAAPYPPTFVTTDAVLAQSGHVLLIQRDAAPGEGLWALPGGFTNQNEYLIDAMIRELREETKIKVPAPVLKGSVKEIRVFDKPNRSMRGRTITHAYYIELPPGELPVVKGSDDARKAKWVPIAEIDESQMFEDHFAILNYFLGLS